MPTNPFGLTRKRFNLLDTGASLAPSMNKMKQEFKAALQQIAAEAVKQRAAEVIEEVKRESRGPAPKFEIWQGGKVPSVARIQTQMARALRIEFDHRPEIAFWIINKAGEKGNSPIVTGDYVGNFELFVEGEPAAVSQIEFGSRVEVINTSPYARMLEVGFRPNGSPFVLQTDPHIVERLAKSQAALKWGRVAKISFNYRDIPDPYILKNDVPLTNGRRRQQQGKRAGDPIRYPAIIIEER